MRSLGVFFGRLFPWALLVGALALAFFGHPEAGVGFAIFMGTGAQVSTLLAGTNENPTLTAGSPTTFFLNTVPDRCPSGPLAYRLPYVVLTISGTIVQPATSGELIYTDDLKAALIQSIDWITAWHGTVVSANHVLGTTLPVVEYEAGGYRLALGNRPATPAAAGTYAFEVSVAIPAGCSMIGDLMGETAQLALLFQTSQLKVNVAAASVLTSLSNGATFGTLTARASAVLYPTASLVLATPIERIMHQVVAGASSASIAIKGFGRETAMQGVEDKGGVLHLSFLTSVGIQGGSFAAHTITQYNFPWRGQNQCQHIQALLSPAWRAMGHGRPLNPPTPVTGGDAEFASYPYQNRNSDTPTTSSTLLDARGLRIFPLVYAEDGAQLCDLQTAERDETVFLTSSSSFSGTHLIPAGYARRWTDGMRNDWVKQVTKGGPSSLAAYVLGPNYAKAELGQRLPAGRHVITEDMKTYLAWQLA